MMAARSALALSSVPDLSRFALRLSLVAASVSSPTVHLTAPHAAVQTAPSFSACLAGKTNALIRCLSTAEPRLSLIRTPLQKSLLHCSTEAPNPLLDRTMYRILAAQGRLPSASASSPSVYSETRIAGPRAPNQVWSWDITKLMGTG